MKVALVTGSTGGIGQAISLHLAQQGYTVVLHYHTQTSVVEKLLQTIKTYSPESQILQADLTNPQQVDTAFMELKAKYTHLDVLIHTAGNFVYKTLQDTSAQDFTNVVNSNLLTTFLSVQQAIPLLQKGKTKRIITFSSTTANQVLARKFTAPYYSAKAGVETLTKSWAYELASSGITINAIALGIVEMAIVETSLETDIVETNQIQSTMPAGRPASTQDITHAIDFLLSPQAQYISGTTLDVSGGWTPYF